MDEKATAPLPSGLLWHRKEIIGDIVDARAPANPRARGKSDTDVGVRRFLPSRRYWNLGQLEQDSEAGIRRDLHSAVGGGVESRATLTQGSTFNQENEEGECLPPPKHSR